MFCLKTNFRDYTEYENHAQNGKMEFFGLDIDGNRSTESFKPREIELRELYPNGPMLAR